MTTTRPNAKKTHIHHNQGKQDTLSDLTCHVCGKEDHVLAAGPGRSVLIQYFAWKEFINLKPFDRFQLLGKKDLCFQCLYQGA